MVALSDEPRELPDLPEEIWATVHAQVSTFEDVWRESTESGASPPRLADHLPLDDPSGGQLLVELIHSDLHFRISAGEPVRIEEYLAAHPGLSSRHGDVAALLAAEFRLRRRHEPGMTAFEYQRRFPKLMGIVTALLAQDETHDGREPAPQELEQLPLPTVPGYELLEILGRGGMGIVYKAIEIRLKRTVALKTLRPGADPSERQRLKREAESAAALAHPHVVPVFAVFEAGPSLFVSSEYLPGGTLAELLQARPLSTRQAVELLEPLTAAVAFAHARGIVHRDLKPSNVLLSASGTPKIADFGLAKHIDDDSELTRTGTVAGSPSYMAPEQAAAQKQVGVAADVWALGTLLYEMLTGRPPFRGATALETLDQVRRDDPVSPRQLARSVPRELETICLKCLEKEPAKRYASADALGEDLARYRRDEPVLARPASALTRGVKWAKRRPSTAALFVALAAGSTASAAALTMHNRALGRLNEELTDSLQDRSTALRQETSARQLAVDAQAKAEQSEQFARRLLFASDMQLASDAVRVGDLPRAAELLETHAGERDGEYAFVWNYLDRLVYAPGEQIDHLGGPAYFVCFSPDGKILAACGAPGEIRLYETGTWRPLAQWNAGQGELNGFAFSPDGTRMASAGDDGTVALWNLATRGLLWRKKVYDAQAYQVAFGLGGSVLAACGRDKEVVLLDPATGEATARLAADEEHVESIAVTPDGRTLLSAGYGGEAVAWDLEARARTWGSRIEAAHAIYYELMSAAASPDGAFAAFGRRHASVLIVEVATGRTMHDGPLPAGSSDGTWHRTVRFLPDGRLAAAADGGVLRLARVGPDGLAPVSEGRPAWLARPGRIGGVAAAGGFVATASRDGVVEAWRPDAERAWWTVSGPYGALSAFVPAAAGPDVAGQLAWWRWLPPDGEEHCLTGSETGELEELPRHENLAWRRGAASADGRRLFAGGKDGKVFGWDMTAEPPVRLFAVRLPTDGHVFLGDPTRDGRRLAASYSRSTPDGIEEIRLSVFDGDTGGIVAGRGLPLDTCRLAFAADGSAVAGSQEAVALLLNAQTLETSRELRGHREKIVALALSADGRRLASAGNDREVIVWETETGRVDRRWQADAGAIESLAFSRDGRLLLTATDARPPRLWDLATGRLLLEPGSATASAVEDWAPAAFTGDGRILAGDGATVVFLDGRPLTE